MLKLCATIRRFVAWRFFDRVENRDSPVVENASYQLDFPNSSWPLPCPRCKFKKEFTWSKISHTIDRFHCIGMVESDRIRPSPYCDRMGIKRKQFGSPLCSSFVFQCIRLKNIRYACDPRARYFAQWREEQSICQEDCIVCHNKQYWNCNSSSYGHFENE